MKKDTETKDTIGDEKYIKDDSDCFTPLIINENLEPLRLLATELEQSDVRKYTCINGFGYSQLERNIVTILTTWQKEKDKVIIDDILKKFETLGEEYDLMLQERDVVRKVSHYRKVIIDKLIEALKPLANLDLTGVTGDTVYQRDKTKIMTKDILTAKELLNSLK